MDSDVMFLPGIGLIRKATAVEMTRRVWREFEIENCEHEWRTVSKGEISEEAAASKGWDTTNVVLRQCDLCDVYLIMPDKESA